MNRTDKICQEGGFKPEGFSGYGSGNFPVFFQYLVLLEIKRREGGFEPTGFFSKNKACLCYCFGSVYTLAAEFETS